MLDKPAPQHHSRPDEGITSPEEFTMHGGTRARRAGLGAFSIAAAVALTITGCTASEPSATDDTGAAGGSLVIGVTSDPDTLFPWKATQFQAVNVLQNIYGTLTEFDEELNVVPGLAESWEVSDDGLTVTFQLREDVTFADGSTFGSEDVKYSLETIKDPATAAVAATSLASVTAVDAPDENTVVLTLSAPRRSTACQPRRGQPGDPLVGRHRGGAQHDSERNWSVHVRVAHRQPVAHAREER
jgi:peptide/nickel transport system substrate-binding protein